MSSYNGSQFIGFAACFPRVLPRWLYNRLFCPSQIGPNGGGLAVPAGLRKIEAALVESGIPEEEIDIVPPSRLDRVVDGRTKIIGVTTSDPLGQGPASSTFSSLIRREPYTAFFFRERMNEDHYYYGLEVSENPTGFFCTNAKWLIVYKEYNSQYQPPDSRSEFQTYCAISNDRGRTWTVTRVRPEEERYFYIQATDGQHNFVTARSISTYGVQYGGLSDSDLRLSIARLDGAKEESE